MANSANAQTNTQEPSGQDQIISTSVILNCKTMVAFQYFTDTSLLTKWLTTKAKVELRIGGKYELFWNPSDPDKSNNSTYGCKVLSFDAPNYLNVEWKGNVDHKSFMNNVRPLTNVTFIFSTLDDGKTKVTVLHTGWRVGKDWDSARQFFVEAWPRALEALEMVLNK